MKLENAQRGAKQSYLKNIALLRRAEPFVSQRTLVKICNALALPYLILYMHVAPQCGMGVLAPSSLNLQNCKEEGHV